MKRFTVPILMTLALTAVLVLVFQTMPLPSLASQQGEKVDALTRFLFSLASFFFALAFSFIMYSVVAFRRRPGDTADARPVHGHTALEVVWTLVPLAIVIGLGVYGALQVYELERPVDDEMLVEVIGQQWAWSFYYPEYGFTSSELVMPLGQPMLFHIYSTDVIHSFWVPEFRLKMDAIPGVENHLRITPVELGDYSVVCAELCGTAHAYMTAGVRVIAPSEFSLWATEQQIASGCVGPEADARARLASEAGCMDCHATSMHLGMIGPTFRGLYGSKRTLDDGSTVIADEDYLRNAILWPGAQLVKGYADLMPKDYERRLSAEQVQELIEYIKTLR